MIMFAYSVKDNAVGAFLPIFFARSKGEAIRSFVSACSDDKHQFALHPHDYVLFGVGEFDDLSGLLKPYEPERIIGAHEVKAVGSE